MREIKEIPKLADSFCNGSDEGTDDKENRVLHIFANSQFTDSENMSPYLINNMHLKTIQSTKMSLDIVQFLINMVIEFHKILNIKIKFVWIKRGARDL